MTVQSKLDFTYFFVSGENRVVRKIESSIGDS